MSARTARLISVIATLTILFIVAAIADAYHWQAAWFAPVIVFCVVLAFRSRRRK